MVAAPPSGAARLCEQTTGRASQSSLPFFVFPPSGRTTLAVPSRMSIALVRPAGRGEEKEEESVVTRAPVACSAQSGLAAPPATFVRTPCGRQRPVTSRPLPPLPHHRTPDTPRPPRGRCGRSCSSGRGMLASEQERGNPSTMPLTYRRPHTRPQAKAAPPCAIRMRSETTKTKASDSTAHTGAGQTVQQGEKQMGHNASFRRQCSHARSIPTTRPAALCETTTSDRLSCTTRSQPTPPPTAPSPPPRPT